MQQRSSFISLLNTISCIAVVLLHANGRFWTFSRDPYWCFANLIESAAYFAVPCFFMITGATLINYPQRYSLKEYFARRCRKTVIPFLGWSIIGLVFSMLVTKTVTLQQLSPAFIYNGIMNTSITSVYWFFPALFCIYLCIPLFAAVPTASRKQVFTYLAAAGFLINTIVPLLKAIASLLLPQYSQSIFAATWPLSVSAVSGNLLYVVLGSLLTEVKLTPRTRRLLYVSALLGFIIHSVGTYCASMSAGAVSRLFKGYAAAPSIMYSVGLFVYVQANAEKIMAHRHLNRVVLFLSKYTFGIYLIHKYLLDLLASRPWVDTTGSLYCFGAPLLVIPLSIGILTVMRRIPFIRRLVP